MRLAQQLLVFKWSSLWLMTENTIDALLHPPLIIIQDAQPT